MNLNLSGLTNLKTLDCFSNQLASLNLSDFQNLTDISCEDNQLTNLYVSTLSNLNVLYCSYNSLTYFNIKNSVSIYNYGDPADLYFFDLNFSANPNLLYLCCDANNIASFRALCNSYGMTSCEVTSYCSFTPGGNYNTIQGNIKYDSDNNGCNNSDVNANNIRLNISDNTNFGSTFTDANGNYVFIQIV